jgi:nucleoside 2-deoxyribosyltransferase
MLMTLPHPSRTLYLAHPLDSRKWVRTWELKLEKKFNIDLRNPFYDGKYENIKQIDANYKTRFDFDPDVIVNGDIDTIHNSDGIIAILDDSVTYGTVMEIAYAHLMGKPVYLLVLNGYAKHPWLIYHADEIFTSKTALIKFLSKKVIEWSKK